MEHEHTPGPWVTAGWKNLVINAYQGTPDQCTICCAPGGSRNASIEEMQANARLIAAAPETAAERDRLKAMNAELIESLDWLLQAADTEPSMRTLYKAHLELAANRLSKARAAQS